MKPHDIEQLMAYADGELDPQQRPQVEQWLRDDPQARAIVERFRQTRAQLSPGLDALLDEPVPQRLIDAIRQHPGPAGSARAPVPEATPAPPSAGGRVAANEPWFWPSLATAASVALVIGLVAGHWWGGVPAAGHDTLAQALQTVPSGQVLQVGTTQVMPLASFRAPDGQVCREFEQVTQGRQVHGIACLDAQQWIPRLLQDHGPADAPQASPPGYATASGENDAVSALVESLRLGPALTPSQEEQALREGWSPVR